MSKFYDVMIGADPEFCMVRSTGSVVEAEHFGSAAEEIGTDGNGVTFEIRPTPSVCPKEVVGNIAKAMSHRVSMQPELMRFRWQAGSIKGQYALGGHIHFGTKRKISARAGTEILTQFVAPLLVLVEDPVEAKERRTPARQIYGSPATPYGKAMDFRIQKHGFEYRMPSSWLVSPQMATAALCLAKVVMSEAINNKSLSPKENVPEGCINLAQTDKLRKKFPVIWRQITEMGLYPKYKKELSFLHKLITEQKNWFQPLETRMDIKDAWAVKATKGKFLRAMRFNEIWKNV